MRLAHHYSTDPEAVGGWPWRWADEGLRLLPELGFLQNFHITQAGVMAASAFGGMKNVKVMDLMHPGAVPESLRKGAGVRWQAKQLNSERAEKDFGLLVKAGLVSQFLFDALTT